ARVLLHASRSGDAAAKAATAVGQSVSDLLLEDLSASGAGTRLMAAAIEKAGRVDAVVNNAGIYLPSSLTGDEADWRQGWAQTMAVNVQAPADICRAAVAHFREKGGGPNGGIIVNIASRAGHRGDGPDHAAYAASKGAVLAMTKTWARALAGENILFYAVAPGWVETRMAPQDIENRKLAVKDIPLGRVAAPEEVAEMIAFLASGACPSATGATFDINGASYVR
ncbi:SDR family NAD(P)-dependent oxidoreductase, partial [Hyphococcus sp.]|uniref:SDR family NAD(P)-dependent oxidoreductase n=1 Tax=Hyphococcus sp. TaxID=2038636 RepID=UPI0037538386